MINIQIDKEDAEIIISVIQLWLVAYEGSDLTRGYIIGILNNIISSVEAQ